MADQLTLSQPGGADYAPHISTGTPGFSDLPTALYTTVVQCSAMQVWETQYQNLRHHPNHHQKKGMFQFLEAWSGGNLHDTSSSRHFHLAWCLFFRPCGQQSIAYWGQIFLKLHWNLDTCNLCDVISIKYQLNHNEDLENIVLCLKESLFWNLSFLSCQCVKIHPDLNCDQ